MALVLNLPIIELKQFIKMTLILSIKLLGTVEKYIHNRPIPTIRFSNELKQMISNMQISFLNFAFSGLCSASL